MFVKICIWKPVATFLKAKLGSNSYFVVFLQFESRCALVFGNLMEDGVALAAYRCQKIIIKP